MNSWTKDSTFNLIDYEIKTNLLSEPKCRKISFITAKAPQNLKTLNKQIFT